MTHNLESLNNPNQGHEATGSKLNNAIKEFGRVICTTADVAKATSDLQGIFPEHQIGFCDTGRCPEGTKILFPISKIPNILDSFVEISENSEVHERHGLRKRQQSILHLSANKPTRSMNRYLMHIQKTLNFMSGERYWQFAMLIARRSKIFAAIMLHEVNPHWHREMNMKQLYLLINSWNLMWENLPTELKFRRVYIPKKLDENKKVIKWRPLGVPTVAWRLYLHAWQQFLMIFLRDSISQHQHGFYKGRGTKTAWEEILSKVIQAPDIYEFDLKGFFPSVNTSYTCWLLKKIGMPEFLANNLAEMSLSYPRYETLDETKLDESNAIFKYELDQLGLLHLEPAKLANFKMEFLNEEGKYTGKVLTPYVARLEKEGDQFLIEIGKELGNYETFSKEVNTPISFETLPRPLQIGLEELYKSAPVYKSESLGDTIKE